MLIVTTQELNFVYVIFVLRVGAQAHGTPLKEFLATPLMEDVTWNSRR